MKVNDPNVAAQTDRLGGASLDRSQQSDAVGRRSVGKTGAGGESPDRVTLSDLGSRLRELNVDSPERLARLEKLSADVAAKRYQPDADVVSQRLVEQSLRPKE